MASNFPKLPGYVVTHDPTIVNHKKVSHVKLDQVRNAKNTEVPLYAVPKAPAANFRPEKTAQSKSFSRATYGNHFGADIQEQFEPTYVKLDKQVSVSSASSWPSALGAVPVRRSLTRTVTFLGAIYNFRH